MSVESGGPAVTVSVPFAQLLMGGYLRLVPMAWPSTHRGWLTLHAGKRIANAAHYLQGTGLRAEGLLENHLLGVIRLLDCFPAQDLEPGFARPLEALLPMVPGWFFWLLTEPRPWPVPVALRGAAGLFQLPWVRAN